ncbi:hypothetical protein KMA67_14415, partial [Enterococcus durans]|uniref:DUF7006 family protein n=1 Tax=Enterococcus durans TaxID=53345 RepID=UPI001D09E40C
MVGEKDYFNFYNEICRDENLLKKYPNVIKEIQDICQNISDKIREINQDNFFQIHSEILGLDSRLQIIVCLLPKLSNEEEGISGIDEKELIDCSRNDY